MNNENIIPTGKQVQRRRYFGLRETVLLGAALATVAVIVAHATPPGLTLSAQGTNYLLLTITNSSPSNSYEIFFTPNFNTGYVWNVFYEGTLGQSNFNFAKISIQSGFYRAAISSDLDGDGIPNWEDANSTNAAIGILTVIIDSPTNHYTFR